MVWAVASSGGSGRTTTAAVEQPPPPQASPIAVRLANAIGRASLGPTHRNVDMTAIAPFAWDRMYVFEAGSRAEIERRLGLRWDGAPREVPRRGNDENLLVFVRDRRVIASSFFSTAIGQLECLVALRGYPRGTPFVVRFTPGTAADPRMPFLTTRHPRGGERLCLRSAAIRVGS